MGMGDGDWDCCLAGGMSGDGLGSGARCDGLAGAIADGGGDGDGLDLGGVVSEDDCCADCCGRLVEMGCGEVDAGGGVVGGGDGDGVEVEEVGVAVEAAEYGEVAGDGGDVLGDGVVYADGD